MDLNNPTELYIKKVSNFMCGILRTFGLWKPFDKSTLAIQLYSSFFTVFLFFFAILYATLMVCNIFFLTDFSDLTNRLFMSLTETASAIKIINFFIYNREWQQILTDIKQFRIHTPKEERIIQRRSRVFEVAFYMYYFAPNVAIQAYALTPLLSGATDLIFSGWYPGFDWTNNRRDYWIIFAYQYIGICITCNINVVMDSYYCFVMHMLSAQINIFGHNLGEIGVKQEEDGIEKSHFKKLIEKIQTHQRLIDTFGLIQKNLQWAYFSQILLSGIVICSVVKELATTSISTETIYYFTTVMAVFTFLWQILLMCLFGQETITEFSLLPFQLYSCGWPDMITKRNTSNFLQFMMILNRETSIMIGKVFPLDLATFNSILTLAYRLFAVMK